MSNQNTLPPPHHKSAALRRLYGFQWDPNLAGLKIFAGGANLSAAFVASGFSMEAPVDIRYGSDNNVSDPSVRAWILALLRSGRV